MKPAAFDYLRPTSAAEALQALADHGGDARLMAGGQSLVPMLNLRLARPSVIVDLSAVDELLGAGESGGFLHVGARTTHAAVEDGGLPDVVNGYLTQVAGGIAYRAIRNRGTMAGSLAHADPAADWPTALSAADASVVLRSAQGERVLALRDFFQGPFSTALREDELVAAIRIPRRSPAVRWAYCKQARKAGEFAQSIVAIVLDPKAGYARVVVGGIAGVPWPLPTLAAELQAHGAAQTAARFGFELGALQDLLSAETPADDPVRLRIHAATLSRALGSLS